MFLTPGNSLQLSQSVGVDVLIDRTQEGLLAQTSCLCHSVLLVKSSLLDILPKNNLCIQTMPLGVQLTYNSYFPSLLG